MATIERFLPESSRERPSLSKRPKKKESPKQWQPRQLLGLVLVAATFVGVYFTVIRADQRQPVVAFTHDLAPGQTITLSDLTMIKAALPHDRYAVDFRDVVGSALPIPVRAGQLVPLSLLDSSEPAELIAVPIKSINLPPITRGARVNLWANGQLVAENVAVESVVRDSSYQVVTVRLTADLTPAVVGALAGEMVIVKVS